MSLEAGVEQIRVPGEKDGEIRQAAQLYLELRDNVDNLPEFEGKIVLQEVLSKLSTARTRRARELVEHRLTALRLQRITEGTQTALEEHLRTTYMTLIHLAQLIQDSGGAVPATQH